MNAVEAIQHDVVLLSRQARNLANSLGLPRISVGTYNARGEEPAVQLSVQGAANSCEAHTIQENLGRSLDHWRDNGFLHAPVRITVATAQPVRLADEPTL